MSTINIAVFPGDGIGPEVIAPTIELLQLATASLPPINYFELAAGAGHYQISGESIPEDSLQRARQADAILLGAMGLPHIRYANGTEIAPQLELREKLDLYAGVRPIRTIAGLPLPLADPRARRLDCVLIRESTEGLFASRGSCRRPDPDTAIDELRISRHTSERLFRFSFALTQQRQAAGQPGRLTLIDKANVLGSFAFFRSIFDDCAREYPGVTADHCYVDAAGLQLVKQPWQFDVMVTENMFGDILSDVGAGLMGGMGFAPSADIGDEHAVFQPCHGSAPDIVGQGKANPVAAILSGAMMLDWLAESRGEPALMGAAQALRLAVDAAFAGGKLLPYELGGSAGTDEIYQRIHTQLQQLSAAGE